MSNKRRLFRELRNTLKLKQDVPNYIPGILGAVINYQEQVSVAGRNGFVYVRVRNSDSEFIEAFNDVVATIYGLPVLLEYKGGYYRVVGRDFGRYATWGSGYGGANLANHGDQHSFGEGSNTGQDVVWVYKRQFMPLLVKPTNPFSKSVSVQDDLFMWNSELKHFTGTSIDFTGAWPANAHSRFITLYVDPITVTVQGITGSSFPSYNYSPGIEAYIPTVSSLLGIPVGSVRCDGNGTDIQWSNLYDIRTFWAGASQSQGIHISQNSIPLVTGTGIDFGAGFNVVTTGSYVYVSSPDRLAVFDDGVFKVTGTAISFDTGLSVVVTGSIAFVNNSLATFLELTDTPKSYSGQAGKVVAVNSGETALEFTSGSSGGGGSTFTDPVGIDGCVLWLKADGVIANRNGNRASLLMDQSGRDVYYTSVNDAGISIHENGKNSKDVLYFSGSNWMGGSYNFFAVTYSIFLVYEPESLANAYSGVFGYGLYASNGSFYLTSAGKSANYESIGGSAASYYSYDGTGALTYVTGTWYLTEIIADPVAFHTYTNNQVDKTGTARTWLGTISLYGNRIFNDFLDNRILRGRLAEILVYNHDLTVTERDLVKTYLNTAYAIY